MDFNIPSKLCLLGMVDSVDQQSLKVRRMLVPLENPILWEKAEECWGGDESSSKRTLAGRELA